MRRSPVQDRAIATALAAGKNPIEAARAAEASFELVRRRMAEPQFREQVREIGDQLFRQFTAQLLARVEDAIATLKAIIDDKDVAASTKVTASRALLDASLMFREAGDTSGRLAKIEAAIEKLQGDRSTPTSLRAV